jgi:hypothetical protein
MTKISDLTVADLRGACEQMERHLLETLKFENARAEVEVTADRATINVRVTGRGVPEEHQYQDPYWVQRWDSVDGDWDALLARVWATLGKHAVPEVREIRSIMAKLGEGIELLADSPSEFAVTLTSRLKTLRDEAGARLIEYQPGE